MEITATLPCDFAEVRDGLLFVIGTPVTRVWRQSYPAPLGLCVAIIIEGTTGELESFAHDVELSVVDADGATLAELKGGIQLSGAHGLVPGESVQLPMIFNVMNLVVPSDGAYDLRLKVDGGERMGQPERRVTVRAMLAPQAPPAE